MTDHGIKRVAVLGAGGTMGFGITRNLCRAGFEVRAWNRSREKAEPLSDDGAAIFDSPAAAAAGSELVLTMLPDADAVLSVIADAFPETAHDGGDAKAIWLQTSTIGEDGIERCKQFADAHGLDLVDAPVLGTKQPALDGELVVMASGPSALKEPLQPLLDAIGKRTMWLGDAGAGSRLKLVTNAWIGTVVEGGAEALALAGALGLDPHLFLEAISGGPLDLPYLQLKGQKMIEHDFEPSFKLKLAAKDAQLAAQAAEQRNLELPVLQSVRDKFEQGIEAHGDDDLSAAYLTLAPVKAGTAG
jgi:3-hydroxyisobutyrate dehydrogenase